MLIFSEEEIRSIYSMKDAINDLKEALVLYVEGKIQNPNRTVINFPKKDASILYMPSAFNQKGFAAVKVVSIFPENPQIGKKTTQGVILLNDAKSGDPLAILEASYLTRLRTGAASAIATDYLAKEQSKTLAVIGCGKMAEEQVEGILHVRNVEEIVLFNRTKEKADLFANKIGDKFSGKITVMDSSDEAIVQSDIIVCATRSETPVFSGSKLKAGTHINGIGSYLPTMQEVDEKTILRSSKIVVDTLEGAKEEAGDLIIPQKKGIWDFDQVYSELGKLVSGEKLGRETEDEITFFKSVGIAYFDLAMASAVYSKGMQLGKGSMISL